MVGRQNPRMTHGGIVWLWFNVILCSDRLGLTSTVATANLKEQWDSTKYLPWAVLRSKWRQRHSCMNFVIIFVRNNRFRKEKKNRKGYPPDRPSKLCLVFTRSRRDSLYEINNRNKSEINSRTANHARFVITLNL